jgi:hypothetical protein
VVRFAHAVDSEGIALAVASTLPDGWQVTSSVTPVVPIVTEERELSRKVQE